MHITKEKIASANTVSQYRYSEPALAFEARTRQPDSDVPADRGAGSHWIDTGTLRSDDELPSVRALASKHLVNPNTVARAYLELEREGLLSKRRGTGTYVSPGAAALGVSHRVRVVQELLDNARAAAADFGLTTNQVRMLVDERLSVAKEKSA